MSSLYLYIFLLFLSFALEKWGDKEKLYRAIREGDPKAFKAFYDSHFDQLFLFLRNRQIRSDVAKDLIQKAFLYIWENRDNIKPEKSLKAYLFRIAYTRMLNYLKQRKETVPAEEALDGVAATHESEVEYRDLQSALQQTIKSMPEKRRMVFESCFIQELTYKETAEVLSVSIKTVESHMALALRDVREALKIYQGF